jgi:hypothetical protein
MAGSKQAAALIAAVLSVTSVSAPAEANRRCGYDRYGYNAPDFSGSYRYYREGWGFGPAYVPIPRCATSCPRRSRSITGPTATTTTATTCKCTTFAVAAGDCRSTLHDLKQKVTLKL